LNIGSGFQSLGEMTQAISYLHKSQQFYQKAKYGSGEGKALYNLANVYLTTLRKKEAVYYYQQAREVFVRYKMPGYALMAKQQIATTNLSLGKIQNAEGELRLVIQGYKKIGDLEGELTASSNLIDVSFAKKNFIEAKDRAEKLLSRLQSTEFSYLTHHTLALLVKVTLKLNELVQAEKYFEQLDGEWEDIRPAFIFMQAHIEQQNQRFQQALNLAKKIKQQIGEQWTKEHQAVLVQFERSLQQNEVIPINY
ncbi:MAG: tetratricopeptide repeat protein, partial [Kangiellaceae bacterium]|nr:tetratricopeptide repeat protein [Kangiellaceae bacterium]